MPPEEDYFSRYLKESSQRADDAKYAPELRELLAKLYKRQLGEAQDLHVEQTGDIVRIGTPFHPVINRGHQADLAAQEKRFTDERERYIREYKDAQRIADEVKLRQAERDKQRRDGPEPPGPRVR